MKTTALMVLMVMVVFSAAAFAEKVTVMTEDELQKYLADSKGMTLYVFKQDTPGKSNCSGVCLQNWPIFYGGEISPPEGIDAKEFGTITRSDGEKQTTFRGYPLYYFAGDGKPGDTKGHRLGNVWHVVHPDKFQK